MTEKNHVHAVTRPRLAWAAKFLLQYCRYALGKRSTVYQQHAVDYMLSGATGAAWMQSEWRGRKLLKSPTDLLMYSEAIHETRPSCIVEVGTFDGGSALWFRDISRALGLDVDVITVDAKQSRPSEDGIRYISGRSADVIGHVVDAVGGRPARVSLDGDHTTSGVLSDMEAYHRFVACGGYMVVEDTLMGALTDDSPARAVELWLSGNTCWSADARKERLGLSFAPGGWLRRLA